MPRARDPAMARVAVDLTGLEPGGANGGARLVALSLVGIVSGRLRTTSLRRRSTLRASLPMIR